MSKVALITTGGTIASENTENGLSPTKKGEELIDNLGLDVFGIDKVKVKNLMNKDSSNLAWSDRIKIGREVTKILQDNDINGVVVTHGTDTLIHTAHILDYGIKGLNKPVVLTGAALPYDNPKSDGPQNLTDSLVIAANADISAVTICVKGCVYKPENLQEISSYDLEKAKELFFPKGRKSLAKIKDGEIVYNPLARNEKGSRKNGPPLIFRGNGRFEETCIYSLLKNAPKPKKIIFDDKFDISGVYIISEAENSPVIFEEGIKKKYIKGLVIKGWGAGHVPMEGEDSWRDLLNRCKREKTPTVMCTKFGGPVSPIYEVGKHIESFGVIPSGDWTSEVAKNRIGFINGHSDLLTNISSEFNVDKHKLWKQLYIGGALFRNRKEERAFELKNKVCTHFDLISSRFLFEDITKIAAEYISQLN